MKNIKATIAVLSLAGIAALSTLTTGCVTGTAVTSSTNTAGSVVFTTNLVERPDTNIIDAALQAIVPTAVSVAVSKDTNAAPYLSQAAIIIGALANNGIYDTGSISNSLSNISINGLKGSPTAIGVENAALAIYQSYAVNVVNQSLDKSTWLKPVLQTLAASIKAGLPPGY